jgi:DNA-binding transcriptional ArsR family regulator
MDELLRIARALGDGGRVRALAAIARGELCLCQLIELLGLSPATVSKHMSVLCEAGLVARRRQGKWHFYRLADGAGTSRAVTRALDWVLAELKTDETVRADARAAREVRRRDLEELGACYRR